MRIAPTFESRSSSRSSPNTTTKSRESTLCSRMETTGGRPGAPAKSPREEAVARHRLEHARADEDHGAHRRHEDHDGDRGHHRRPARAHRSAATTAWPSVTRALLYWKTTEACAGVRLATKIQFTTR